MSALASREREMRTFPISYGRALGEGAIVMAMSNHRPGRTPSSYREAYLTYVDPVRYGYAEARSRLNATLA